MLTYLMGQLNEVSPDTAIHSYFNFTEFTALRVLCTYEITLNFE